MNEEEILDHHCKKIIDAMDHYITFNHRYSYDDLKIDIRAEVQEAMRKARYEASRGN